MKLSQYLSAHKLTLAEFGKRIGKTPSAVKMLRDGTIWPAQETAEAIARATDGQVTANDFTRSEKCASPADEAAA